MITLSGWFTYSGIGHVDFDNLVGPVRPFDATLERIKASFPHVVAVPYDAAPMTVRFLLDREFEPWTSCHGKGHAFFCFSRLTDAAEFRLLM